MNNPDYPLTWRRYTFRAMGSRITLWLDAADGEAAAETFKQVEALSAANEHALSRFRPDSELSQLNTRDGQWVEISALLWRQLTLAVEMAALTGGRFDPTLLNDLRRSGYAQSFDDMEDGPINGSAPETTPLPGQWSAIQFDESRRAVKLPLGVQIDLGGIAKGDTAQQAVRLMEAAGPCLVDAGGDLVAGAAPLGFPGWPAAISAPWAGSESLTEDIATLWLAAGALATSGIDYRTWTLNGRLMHHLIDPMTGSPAQTDGLTATVFAEDAAHAEAWATATLVAGSSAGLDALLDHDIAGLIVTQDGRILATPPMDRLLHSQPAPLHT